MLDVAVYNMGGEQVDTLKVDERALGGTVNAPLLKQAVVAYAAARRRGTAAAKGRAQVAGSGRKLFRQKGTGHARRGNIRTNLLRGGGVAFPKRARPYRKDLSRKMRRRALQSALLAKILGEDLLVVDGLKADEPRTRLIADLLGRLEIRRSCVLALAEHDANLYKSARNIPDVTVRVAGQLNAHDVATRQKMLATREAMELLLAPPT